MPFADAGASGSNYKIWLPFKDPAPGRNLLADGVEIRSRKPNAGSISDGNVETIAATFNGKRAPQDWFGVELEEAVTDPDLNAWYDNRGMENADKCAWTFGTVQTAGNGSKYNMTLGTMNYLIQRNWVNASGGFCALSY